MITVPDSSSTARSRYVTVSSRWASRKSVWEVSSVPRIRLILKVPSWESVSSVGVSNPPESLVVMLVVDQDELSL